MTKFSTDNEEQDVTKRSSGLGWLGWIVGGAAYGVFLRYGFGVLPGFVSFGGVMSMAFLLGTPFVVGAFTVYGKRNEDTSLGYMIFGPWATVGLMLLGCAITLLEGSICIAMMSPLFLLFGSLGGIVMGVILLAARPGPSLVGSFAVLPFVVMVAESFIPYVNAETEIRSTVVIDASPQRVWEEIMNAKAIRPEELPLSLSHIIGVPKPVDGVNRITPEGEIRYSTWERGVHFEALVSERELYRTIRWHYAFDAHSFPEGSMDEHVEIGGKFFGLQDTTFNLTPRSGNRTELELVAHYRVTTSINFYAVPVANVLGRDFVSTILDLYKGRSEGEAEDVVAVL